MFRDKKQFSFVFLLLLGSLHPGFASAAILSLVPASINTVETSSFDVDVVISELGGALVGGLDVTVGYDSSLLTATGVTFSGNLGSTNPLDGETLSGSDLLTAGSVSFNETSLLFLPFDDLADLQSGISERLATLTFMANSVGSASLAFTFSLIVDDFGVVIPLTAAQGAVVNISPIPLPGALWLMLSGLLGVGAMARRRSSLTISR